ncbi:mitochondrial distribution and morphology protein 10 [Cylindrobasidium torrendii FP15055 ss-10]|uniref:Mitochondrial distribution and morphology protein 10 n=1 Tax=Cylindrobasidium torrendii FP15055 ss-10 TaxID=1314674 RepID=A0A0D7BSN3_9AGAR|nr:mitochondrial distribution and morphology protein 10 [Cylindrobasidium torrendii FP15055 ss-10]
MHPFASYVLRSYYKATGWNEDNLFSNLTRSSDVILDFTVPKGLNLSISKSPNALFKTTYSMNAMPSLNGSVGYIFSSCDLNIQSSGTVRFREMIERFKVYDQPRRPEPKDEEWVAGQRVDARDYLMYGRLYIPTGRLDALYSTRLSPTLQGIVAAISEPPLTVRQNDPSNVMFSLQHDVGKWCSEYTYSAEDGMVGVKVLHNFGRLASAAVEDDVSGRGEQVRRIDEEEATEGGLKGRISAGAEMYFSAKEKSAGISTGFRFSTLPDATPPSAMLPQSSNGKPPQPAKPLPSPPTTITALFNPMLGHLSGAYSARTSRDLALSSRFDFNIYSYESEFTMGAEWWLRRRQEDLDQDGDESFVPQNHPQNLAIPESPVIGVVKARASTSNDISIMWEGRLRNTLVSLGIVSDFSNRAKPLKAIGLEVSYFGSE